MKKLILGIACCLVAAMTFAQPQAGSMFVGGNIGLSSYKNKIKNGGNSVDTYSAFNFNLLPEVGLMMSENMAIGARAGFNMNAITTPAGNDDRKRTTTSFLINPFARYYVGGQVAGFFAEANMALGFGSAKQKVGSTSTDLGKVSSFELGVAPGVYFFLNEKISLNAKFGLIGFSNQVFKDNNDVKDIDSGFNFGINTSSITFGLNYHL